ncbi:MAG TPA: hypothetical protein VHE61_01770 [Opitutaceae bacterium]|nr:hypothetical protein [Opitutaceae bacterium]
MFTHGEIPLAPWQAWRIPQDPVLEHLPAAKPMTTYAQKTRCFVLVFSNSPRTLRENFSCSMPKPNTLDWCIVRLGDDHNWWVVETSDPVRWDVDGLSIVDPRQVQHLIELVEPLRDYGFDQDVFESAFIPFRIERDLGNAKVRLKRVKESLFESDEKLFGLPDILDEENGPYADLLDHLTRCRVKMLNDLFDFESKLSVDEVEDEIREDQNTNFIQGQAVHTFDELTAILDYMPAGYDIDEEAPAKAIEDEEDDDLPELDAEEEEKLKNDESLKWDEDEEGAEGEDAEKKSDDEDGDDDEDADSDSAEEDDDEDEEGEKPPRRSKGKR